MSINEKIQNLRKLYKDSENSTDYGVFDPAKYTNNSARPLPVILLLDRSGSMGEIESGEVERTGEIIVEDGKEYEIVNGGISKIQILNQALNDMINSFKEVGKNETEINVGVISFGSDATYDIPIKPAKDINTLTYLKASGNTSMGEALRMAKKIVEDKNIIPSKGYRPTIVLVSDGEPNDDWENAMNDFVSNGRSAKCERFALAIGQKANREILGRFLKGTVNKVQEANEASKIKDFFKFVTMSVTKRSTSNNPNILLPPTENQEMLDEMGF